MGNGSILPMQQAFPMICTPSAIYLSRNGRSVSYTMFTDTWIVMHEIQGLMILQILFPAASPWEWTHIWTYGHSSVLPTTNTLESDFSGLFWLICEKKHAKCLQSTSSPSPPSRHAPGHGGVLSAGTIGLNVVKMSRMSVLGQREGGLSLGSDEASKSKLKRSSIFHHFRRWRLGSSFMLCFMVACEWEPIAEREWPKNTHFWICCRLNNHLEW